MAVAAQPVQPRPVAGLDYPGTLAEFFDRFQSEGDCWNYLVRLRWPDGFRCPHCGGASAWLTERRLFVCASCRRQTSATAGTIFEGSRLPLLQWFLAAWLITSRKSGVSASTLQVELGLSSYKTAWMVEHKLRKAMVRPNAPKLSGEIEVDETFIGGPRPGKRGRGAANKIIVVIAVEKPTGHVQYGLGRVRMRVIPRVNSDELCGFVTDVCESGSVIYTDGNPGYVRLSSLDYEHVASVHSDTDDPDWVAMRSVHRIASLLKRWLLGTHQGSVAAQHLDYYLDEFAFRFNRRRSRSRGLLFYRLMQLAVQTRTIEYRTIVWSRRTNETKRRGVPRGTPPVRRRRSSVPRR